MNIAKQTKPSPPYQLKRTGNPDPVYMTLDEFVPEHEKNAAAYAFWRSLPRRDGASVPLASDCDLLEIAELLSSCLMLDIKGPTEWPISLFGTELVASFGVDATGLNGYDLYAPEERVEVARRLDIMRASAAVMSTQNRLKNAHNVTIQTEWVFLPLAGPPTSAGSTGTIDRLVISIASFDGAPPGPQFEMDGSLQDRRLLKLIYASD